MYIHNQNVPGGDENARDENLRIAARYGRADEVCGIASTCAYVYMCMYVCVDVCRADEVCGIASACAYVYMCMYVCMC